MWVSAMFTKVESDLISQDPPLKQHKILVEPSILNHHFSITSVNKQKLMLFFFKKSMSSLAAFHFLVPMPMVRLYSEGGGPKISRRI